jgi:hypothetical protein
MDFIRHSAYWGLTKKGIFCIKIFFISNFYKNRRFSLDLRGNIRILLRSLRYATLFGHRPILCSIAGIISITRIAFLWMSARDKRTVIEATSYWVIALVVFFVGFEVIDDLTHTQASSLVPQSIQSRSVKNQSYSIRRMGEIEKRQNDPDFHSSARYHLFTHIYTTILIFLSSDLCLNPLTLTPKATHTAKFGL